MLFKRLLKLLKRNDESEFRQPDFEIHTLFNDESTRNNRISEVISWAKKQGYLAKLDISEDSAKSLLQSMLVERDLPQQLRNNEQLRGELKQVAIEKIGENSPLPPDEANRVFQIIQSGEIFSDIAYSFEVIFGLVKSDRTFSLNDGFKNSLDALIGLPGSLISDLNPSTAFNAISSQIQQIQAGSSPADPKIFDKTLKTIFSISEAGETIGAINALLAPENETLRIALLVYARVNGINLEQKDIDKVREGVA